VDICVYVCVGGGGEERVALQGTASIRLNENGTLLSQQF